jgi:hypothetical protein
LAIDNKEDQVGSSAQGNAKKKKEMQDKDTAELSDLRAFKEKRRESVIPSMKVLAGLIKADEGVDWSGLSEGLDGVS